MFGIQIIICVHILFHHIAQTLTIVKTPSIDDNVIAETESIIRDTVNGLFAGFKIPGIKNRTRMKQFSTIHNFFASILLSDCDTFNITRLTAINNIDSGTKHFIAEINEFINDFDNKAITNEDENKSYIETYIENFITITKYYNVSDKNYTDPSIRPIILKYLTDDNKISPDYTKGVNFTDEPQDKELHYEFWLPNNTRRLYRGIRTTIKQYPFMASVHFFKQFQCAGSIIKEDLVITSSSCLQISWNNRFFRENPAFLSVRVGCDYYDLCGESIPVLEIYFHPQYEPNTLKHNVALMRLSKLLKFGKRNTHVKKISFDRSPSVLPITDMITVVGWGARDDANIVRNLYRNKLSYSNLEYFPWEDCQKYYVQGFVSKYNFCAGYLSKKGGACSHDAGGPGIRKGILMGVISFGSPICGAPNIPTVFTKLGFYKDWIDDILEKESPNHAIDFLKSSAEHNTEPELRNGSLPHQQDLEDYISIILENSKRYEEASKIIPLDLRTEHKTFLNTIYIKSVNSLQKSTNHTDVINYTTATTDKTDHVSELVTDSSSDSNGNEEIEALSTESLKESFKNITIQIVEETNKKVEDTGKSNILTLNGLESNSTKVKNTMGLQQNKASKSTLKFTTLSMLSSTLGSNFNFTTPSTAPVGITIKNDMKTTDYVNIMNNEDKSLEEEIKNFIDNLDLDQYPPLGTNLSAIHITDSKDEIILNETLTNDTNSSCESILLNSYETTESSKSEEDVGLILT